MLLCYECDRARLGDSLAETFVALEIDDEARAFVEGAEGERAGLVRTLVLRLLARFVSDYDAHGLLGMYAMHLFGTEQLRRLLPTLPAGARFLDVGAGAGDVTARAAPLFAEVTVTESSRVLRERLAARGHRVVDHDLGRAAWPGEERFDVVGLLNVLDRTARPRTLLAHARDVVVDGGRLLVSVPLPLRPVAYLGPKLVDPDEPLPAVDAGWEECVVRFVEDVIEPASLRVERLARVPYLSRGDALEPLYVLDAAVLVCRRR